MGPHDEDQSILGSILGPPVYGNPEMDGWASMLAARLTSPKQRRPSSESGNRHVERVPSLHSSFGEGKGTCQS